jgi:exonuclease III
MSNLNLGSNRSLSILSWNVRGLGDPDKCSIVREAISSANPTIMCIQESKLHDVDRFKRKTFLPPQLTETYIVLPAIRSRGGIITAWNTGFWCITDSDTKTHSLTTSFNSTLSDFTIHITNAYGPSDHRHTNAFLQELLDLSTHINGPWVIIGDFNLIRSREEKTLTILTTPLCLPSTTLSVI